MSLKEWKEKIPWGGQSGNSRDDVVHTSVKQSSNSKDLHSLNGILRSNIKNMYDNCTIVTNGHSSEDYKHANLQEKMISFHNYVGERGSVSISTPITYGPWGGSGGTIFDDGMYTGVRQINLIRAAGISSIKVLYDRNGQAVWGNKHGYNTGLGLTDKITFDFPTEILTHITGYFGPTMIMGPIVIKSLTFHTTKRVHGPFGDELGTFFSSCLTEGRVVGFHGREGWFIDGLGVHVLEGKVSVQKLGDTNQRRLSNTSDYNSNGESNQLVLAKRSNGDEVVTYGVLKEPVPCGPGPWGGDGGRPWDDGVYSGIKQILISRGKFIHSIQIEYDRGGQSVWSARHGGAGELTHRIKFTYPNEVLNCITGYYNTNLDEGPSALRSISLHTSRGKYGPFGEETGTYFTSTTTQGKVVGFHGRSGLYLDAIGVHMQHWLGERKLPTKSKIYKYFA
ncbi:hypothetical protein LUZ60_001481 [Juncus effusus]|nr:hypothetical protein LUZ60_001481 [Juncus effusus]